MKCNGKNPARQHKAETLWCKMAPYRMALKQDCPNHIKLILLVNRWINPWHALTELEKEIPFKRRQELKSVQKMTKEGFTNKSKEQK